MTNAIEQAKREMYLYFGIVKDLAEDAGASPCINVRQFEDSLEKYLELLRQDHEALHETARKRFEDLQVAEAANQELASKAKRLEALTSSQQKEYARDGQTIDDLEFRLSKMTEERDSIQLRLHAIDHAYNEQQSRVGTSGQVSGDRASCAKPDAKTMAVLSAVLDCQQILTDWAVYGDRAKKQMKKLAAKLNNNPKLATAMVEFEKMTGSHGAWFVSSEACMHSFFAIGDDQMKCTFCGVGK